EAISKAIAARLLPEVTVSDTELQAAFDERKDIVGESFRASTNIAFMDDQTSAENLKAQLEDGKEFLAAAKALGEATLTAETVDVNPLSPLPPAFIDVVKGLKVGAVAEPIQYDVDDGAVFVVLQQNKREDLPALTLDQARPELIEIVKDKKRLAVFEQWFEKQFAAAKVDVDGYYGKWNASFQAVT
ncbi:MAG: peptidylprolyl isomerase, partial [Sporichthyaceae bacterium]